MKEKKREWRGEKDEKLVICTVGSMGRKKRKDKKEKGDEEEGKKRGEED